MLRKPGFLLLLPLFLLSAFQINAQTVAQNFSRHNWFFGNSSDAIVFNKSDNEPNHVTTQATPFGDGGSAVATDPLTGELLFYTDGTTIYDASHQIMDNGTGLNGIGITNQPAAICPVPNTDSQFYVFTNSGNQTSPGIIEYSIVDMSQQGTAPMFQPPRGSVIQKNMSTTVANTSEAMIIVPNPGLTACWLITQDFGSATYNVLEISSTGVTNVQSFNLNAAGALSLVAANFAYTDGDGGKIAVAPQNSGRNVQILNFDRATGVITFQQDIPNSGNSDGGQYAVYDTEWSATGTKLYISRHGGTGPATGQLYQYDPNTPNIQPLLPAAITRSLGLRLGPDDRIYHLYENSVNQFFVARINLPDLVRDSVDYELTPEEFENIGFNGRQFPEFAFSRRNSGPQTIMWIPDPACSNNLTRFFPDMDPMGVDFSWNFNNEGSANLIASSFTFQSGGPKQIQVRYFINGQPQQEDTVVNIQQSMLMVQLQNDTICPMASTTLDATTMEAISYVWHDGSTSPTFTTDTAGVYWVIAEDALGCKSYSSAEVVVCGEERRTSSVWYFGQNAGINFNDPATAISGPMDTPEGTSTISDRNGNVIFYTDGETVWNREGNVMPNGTDIGGNRSSTQSSLIMRFPDDETLFYIFTTEEIFDQSGNNSYRFGYAVVDIKEDSGLGDVVIKQKPLFEKSTERIAGIDESWVVGHEFGTNTFRAYPIVPEGIGNPVLSSVGSIHSVGNQQDGEGYMAFSPTQDKLAVAINGQNAVEVFSFADSTGVIDSVARVELTEAPYGVAFSSSGNYLFASTPNRIFRIRTDTTFAAIESTPPEDFTSGSGPTLGAIQRGPDGQLYVARDGQGSLGRITNPDDTTGRALGYIEDGFPLAGGTTSRLGLPNFAESNATSPQPPGMAIDGFCLQEPTTLSATGPCGSLDRFEWTIVPTGDTTVIFSSFMENDSLTFTAPGLYDVNLKIFNCDPEPVLDSIATIEISAPPVLDSIPAFVPLCNGSAEVSAASQDTVGLSYLWSPNGETTRTVTITEAGRYSVMVSNPAGCVQSMNFDAAPVSPVVDLGPDRIYCVNDQADSLNAANPNSTFAWDVSLDGNPVAIQPGDTTRIYDVVTDTPGTYLYMVAVTDMVTACVTMDTVMVEVLSPPTFTATANDSPGCGAPNGSIDLDVTSSGSFTYNISDGTSIVLSDTVNGPGAVSAPGLLAGAYQVTLVDNISQCEQVISGLTIQDLGADFQLTAFSDPTSCDADDGVIRVITDNPAIVPLAYDLILQDDNSLVQDDIAITTLSTFAEGPGFEIIGLAEGTYSVEVTAGGATNTGCTITVSDIEVDVVAANVDFQTPEFVDACGTTADIPVSSNTPGAIFAINGPGGSVNNGTFYTVDTQGIYTFTASDPAGILCDSVRMVEVTLIPDIQVQIDSTGLDCSGSRLLTATILNPIPNSTYTYQWYLNGIGDANRIANAFGSQINVTESGDYFVQVGNTQASCVAELGISGIEVITPVEINLSATTSCDRQSSIVIDADVSLPGTSIIWFDATGNQLTEFDGQFSINVNERGSIRAVVSQTVSGLTCTQEEFIVLNDICPPQIFVHTAIRPDSNTPENRTFYVHNPNDLGDRFQVYIFNRWGEMIFESGDKNFVWNGTFKGEDVQVDTYPFLIRYSFADNEGGVLEKRGGVTVVR